VSQALIEVRDFSFAIEGRAILSEVSLEVAEGQHLSIIGPNGAGKTTLLRCLLRILEGGTGAVRVDGRPLEDWDRRELARTMSYVPQAAGRQLPYTAGEFVAMGRYPYLSPFSSLGAEDREAIRHAMELTGCARFAGRMLDTLSGGERQEVMIAAALAQQARVMVLDEPTTFLDYKHQASIHRILGEVSASGVTVISVTHDANAALAWSDSILALREGRVVFSGSPRELVEPGVLASIFETEFCISDHPASGNPVILPGGRQ
jgi:iron complex transport system ATP-binding protein